MNQNPILNQLQTEQPQALKEVKKLASKGGARFTVDCGSGSTKLVVQDKKTGKSILKHSIGRDLNAVVKPDEGLAVNEWEQDRQMSWEAYLTDLQNFVAVVKELGAQRVSFLFTAAVRDGHGSVASAVRVAVQQQGKASQIIADAYILSPEDEALFCCLGAISALPEESKPQVGNQVVYSNMGGRSYEIVMGDWTDKGLEVRGIRSYILGRSLFRGIAPDAVEAKVVRAIEDLDALIESRNTAVYLGGGLGRELFRAVQAEDGHWEKGKASTRVLGLDEFRQQCAGLTALEQSVLTPFVSAHRLPTFKQGTQVELAVVNYVASKLGKDFGITQVSAGKQGLVRGAGLYFDAFNGVERRLPSEIDVLQDYKGAILDLPARATASLLAATTH